MNAKISLWVAVTVVLFLGTTAWAQKNQGATASSEPWWGNGAVSYRNYMKFERVKIGRMPSIRQPAKKASPAPTFAPIYFDFDKAELKPEGIAVADQVGDYVKANPGKSVRVEGYCCDLGSDDYNMKLGERRADAVKKCLVDEGVRASRIKTVSFGEERPATTDPAKRALNRRAAVIVKPAKSGSHNTR